MPDILDFAWSNSRLLSESRLPGLVHLCHEDRKNGKYFSNLFLPFSLSFDLYFRQSSWHITDIEC